MQWLTDIARFVAAAGAIFGAAILTGCATPGQVALVKGPDEGQGVVVARAAGNRLAMSSIGWTALNVRSASDGSAHAIRRFQHRVGDQRFFFVGQLRPGTYRLEGIEGATLGLIWDLALNNLSSASVAQTTGAFTVEAGRITNLGTLFAYRPLGSSRDAQFHVTRVNSAVELDATLRSVLPDALAPMRARATLGWNEAVADNLSLMERARNNSYPGGAAFAAPDGSFWVGGQSGQVLVRRGPSDWTRWDTGLVLPVHSARPFERGALAGLEDGIVMLKQGNASWRDISVPFPGSVIAVGELADGRIAAVSSDPFGREQKVEIFASACCEDVNWKRLHSIELDGSWIAMSAITPTTVLLNIVTPGLPPRRRTVRYSVAGDSVSESAGGGVFTHLGLDGRTLCSMDAQSRDLGVTWSDVTQPGSTLVCRDASLMYSVKRESMGWEANTNSLHGTLDGGRTWRKLSDPLPPNVFHIDILRDSGHLLARASNGKTYFSADDGATWHVERAVEDTESKLITK